MLSHDARPRGVMARWPPEALRKPACESSAAGCPKWLSEGLFGATVIPYLRRASFLSGAGPASQVASGSIAAACCARASTVNSQ